MTKGERTRQLIIERSAPVFNTRGFFGASMSDLTDATGLEKGGLYNHFQSKEAIALAAFDHAVGLVEDLFRDALAGRERTLERLKAIVEVFRDLADGRPLAGGCPVLNTAIASDDTQPALRDRARGAMSSWLKLIGGTIKRGVERGELRADTDPRAVATIVAATLEGAIMLTRLYDDPAYMHRAIDHLSTYFDGLTTTELREG